jgi:flotillin
MVTAFIIGGLLVVALIVLGFVASCYKRVNGSGEALVITRFGSSEKNASLSGAFVWPKINFFERIDLTRKPILVSREGVRGKTGEEYEGLPCKDDIRADIRVAFYIGVSPEEKDILLLAENLTCAGASDIETLKKHLTPKFSEALKTAIKQFDFVDLYKGRKEFRDQVKQLLENDMEGFKLYDVVIDKIEQTPLDALDPNNILDVNGINKITKITAEKNIDTAQVRENERTETKKRSVDGDTARLQLDRTLAEETEKTQREIKQIQITEKTHISVKEEEARLVVENIKIKTAQEVEINEQNKSREVEVARINNDKTVEIQREQVNRAKEVERVTTDREVVKITMDKEKFVEGEKKEIATIVAERTKTEREIAIEEEQTKDIKAKSGAERDKLVTVTASEATAKADAVKKVTASEADLNATRNTVQKDNLIADNQLIIANKTSEAKERMATATRHEQSAQGLAEADVRARLAEVGLKESEAEAEKVKRVGLAEVEVKVQDAEAIEKLGLAEAVRVKAMGLAEAESSEAKYKAMSSIDPEVRQHEINKLNIEKDKEVQIVGIKTNGEIAAKNAEVMAAAMAKADIKMIGGGDMFDSIRKAVIASESLDARVDNSDVLKGLFGNYINGEKDLVQDIKEVLQKSETSTGDVGSLMLASSVASWLKANPNGIDMLQGILNKASKS